MMGWNKQKCPWDWEGADQLRDGFVALTMKDSDITKFFLHPVDASSKKVPATSMVP